MRLLLDMNMPATITAWLRAEGHYAEHLRELGLARLPDPEVFARAAAEQRVNVTFDLDFGEIVGLAFGAGVGVVLLRLRSARMSHLQQRLAMALLEADLALQAGAIVLVEDARIRIRPTTHQL
jgi:predicted nuclease of predicted toxin-antitoxin system